MSPGENLRDELEELAGFWEDVAAEQDPAMSDTWNARCVTWGNAANQLRETLEK